MDYLVFNGIEGRLFGAYVARRNGELLISNIAPSKSTKTIDIAGKHGKVVTEQTYNERQIDVTLLLTRTSDYDLKVIASWLSRIGTFPLILPTEPYKVYYATVENVLNPSLMNINQGMLDITFTCYNPFGYSQFTTLELESDGINYDIGLIYGSGLEYVDLSDNSYTETVPTAGSVAIPILQGGNSDYALPKITLKAGVSGAGGFKLEHYYGGTDVEHKIDELTYSVSIPSNGSVIIDSEISEVYDENGDILTSNFDGNFFTFKGVGDPDFIAYGDIISTTGLNVTLDSNASSVDDFYNGLTMMINGASRLEAQYVKIADYNGTTKVATVSKAIENDSDNNLIYGIYDFSSKLNYIKYSYSSPIVAQDCTISFDFKFNYL